MAATKFTIQILRKKDKGILRFRHGNVRVSTTCWWDPGNRIDPDTYTGAATHMTKGAKAIYLGKTVYSNGGTNVNDGIFIHRGTSAAASEGCIVAAEDQVLKIWETIHPKEDYIVKIRVRDVTPREAKDEVNREEWYLAGAYSESESTSDSSTSTVQAGYGGSYFG